MNHTENDAVNEIIREENAPQTLEDVAREIRAAMALNATLNHALNSQIQLVAKMQGQIDRTLTILAQMEAHYESSAWTLIGKLVSGGSHAERNIDALAAIAYLRAMVSSFKWDVNRIRYDKDAPDFPPEHDQNDIPF